MADVSLQERLEEATEDLQRCQVSADVANILRVEGVQGERRESCSCPLVVLVIKRLGLGAGHSVQVDGDYVEIYEPDAEDPAAHLSLPAAARVFVSEFDGESVWDDERRRYTYRNAKWDEFAVEVSNA